MNLEKEINTLHSEINELKKLSDSQEVVSDYVKLSELLNQISEKQDTLDSLETEWLELS